MIKSKAYHEAAIAYNQKHLEFEKGVLKETDDNDVKRWCHKAIKRYRFHLTAHESALAKLDKAEQEALGATVINVTVNSTSGSTEEIADQVVTALEKAEVKV